MPRQLGFKLIAAFFCVGFACMNFILGLWSECIIYQHALPGAKKINSQISMVYNLANIVPVIYSILINRFKIKTNEFRIQSILLFINIVNSIAYFFLWDYTASGLPMGMYALSFVCGITATFSMVVVFPLCHGHPHSAITSVSSGMSFSGVLCSLVATYIQKVGKTPNFSSSVFFGVMILPSSILGFLALYYIKYAAPEEKSEGYKLVSTELVELQNEQDADEEGSAVDVVIAMGVVSAVYYFILPGLIPYVFQHFPEKESDVFQSYATLYAMLINFVARLMVSLRRNYTFRVEFLLLSLIGAYLIYTAVPGSFVLNGYALVGMFVALSYFQGYLATVLYIIGPDRFNGELKKKGTSRLIGVVNQIGSTVGTYANGFLVMHQVFG
ncbi:hypothetical protein PCE1_001134 [Barthelona sp. PCE]